MSGPFASVFELSGYPEKINPVNGDFHDAALMPKKRYPEATSYYEFRD